MYETAGTRPGAEPWVRGRRRVLLAAGMLAYPTLTAVGVSTYSTGGRAVAGYVIVAAFCCCYILAGLAGARQAWRTFWAVIGVQFALIIAVMPFAREQAFLMAAVTASLAVIVLRRHEVLITATVTLAAVLVPVAVPSWDASAGLFPAIAIIFTVLISYAFTEMVTANRALIEARAEIAQLASEAERNRIARDLHDLLGHSLTTITVKAGLARRIGANDVDRSLREIAEVENLSRQALTDVRAAVSGYREVTLAGELARGKELLRAAGVVADLPTATDVVDAAHREVLAWAVREGLTNVARHARATRCTVTLSAAQVEIRDDGVGGAAADGNGLSGLRERVAAVGGKVEAGPLQPRGWRLSVNLDPAVKVSA